MSVICHFVRIVYFEWDEVICFLETSNRPEVLCDKGVLKNSAIFTGKHLCWSLFSIKLQA